MGQYRQAQITNAGLTLIEQAQITENALTFTALKTGNGEYTGEEDLKLCTELKNAKNTFTIAKVTQEEQKIKIASQITNEDVPEGYSITEIGIFGQLDGGEETLIAITSSVNPDFLPATTVTPSTILVEVHLEVTNADDVEFTYTIPEGVYATLEDYEEQNVRLEEVDEKLKELENPEYDISLQKDVENLSSGESLRVALRKIAKAVKTLIEHLANKENPHGVSAEDVGLGEVTNESKETMFTNPTFTGITNAEGYGFGDNGISPTRISSYEIETDVGSSGIIQKTTVVGINAGLHLDGDLETANFQGLASNFTTENWKMGAAAPLVKQLYEENQSLREEISTLNSNKATRGIATGTTNVLYRAYNSAGISTNGIKTIMIATDSNSMNYAVFLVYYVHGTQIELVKLLDGGIDKSAYNNVGTISWTGNTGAVTVVVMPVQ